MTQRLRETPRLWWLGYALAIVLIQQITVVAPTVIQCDWTRAWGTVAGYGNMAGWLIPVVFGTLAVLGHAPAINHHLRVVIASVLALNLLAYVMQVAGLWSLWRSSMTPGVHAAGLLPNTTVWGAWCAISLPILWQAWDDAWCLLRSYWVVNRGRF